MSETSAPATSMPSGESSANDPSNLHGRQCHLPQRSCAKVVACLSTGASSATNSGCSPACADGQSCLQAGTCSIDPPVTLPCCQTAARYSHEWHVQGSWTGYCHCPLDMRQVACCLQDQNSDSFTCVAQPSVSSPTSSGCSPACADGQSCLQAGICSIHPPVTLPCCQEAARDIHRWLVQGS